MSKRGRRFGSVALLAMVGVALVEWVAAARAYRDVVHDADFTALAEAVSALPPDEPVLMADAWLGPRARMRVPALARIDAATPPDLRAPGRVHVLGVQGRAWSESLQTLLEDRSPPIREGQTSWGGLTLTTWAWPSGAPVLASFADEPLALRVQADGKACKGKRTFKCTQGHVRSEVLEVQYQPRRCLTVDVTDGTTVALSYPNMALGTVLRGHIGWGDFNRRLRSDAPIGIVVRIDDEVAARFVATDAQGWRPLAIATEAGHGDVVVELTAAVQGTWQRTGYASNKAHTACFELRALDEERTP